MDGKKIKEAVKAEGRTLADLAAFLDMSPQNLNGLLSKDDIKTGTLERIAEFLNKPVYAFYDAEPQTTAPSGERVPLIPVEAHAGHLSDFADAVSDYDCEKVVSPVRGASFAIQVTGESMAPAYPSGAKILCQRVDETAFIEWGRVYLLDTVNGAILKQVRKADRPDRVVCCSLNPSPEYAPFEVDCQHILGWYRVLMIMSLV